MVAGKFLDRDTQTAQNHAISQATQPTNSREDRTTLRLMILTQFFPPDFAATGQLIEELVKHLGHQGVDVSVFTGQPGYAFEKGDAPRVEQRGRVKVKRSRLIRLLPSRIRGKKALNGLLFAIRVILHLMRTSRQYDVTLVTTAPPFLPIISYLSSLFLGIPYVCLLYDLYPDIAVKLGIIDVSHPVARIWHKLNQQVWKRAQGIIVLSDSMKQCVVSHCPEIESKVSVIHSWANTDSVVPIEKQHNWFAKENGLVDPFVVMYSGNMGRCHDIDTIFEAAKQLKDEPILFVCIGGGAKREPLKGAVAEADLDNFLFLPYQEKSDLPYSLTACDLSLVSVSKGMESLVAPSKLYPAMATGRPIAAVCPSTSYLGSLLEASQSGAAFENGESTALAKYIKALCCDRDLSSRLGAAGRSYIQAHFTPSLVAQQYLSVLEKSAEPKSTKATV